MVDALPQRWWALGNLHRLPGTIKSWHFCVATGGQDVGVRTIGALGRTLAWGRHPFDYERSQLDGQRLARRQDADDDRRYGSFVE